MYKTDNNQIVITHEELETIIKKAFLKGENWGLLIRHGLYLQKLNKKMRSKK